MDRPPYGVAAGMAQTRAAISTPLSEERVYRPGPIFALAAVSGPVVVALVAAATALRSRGTIPVWLPLVLLLWLPCLVFVWLGGKSVRLSAFGIAAGKPWQHWRELPWDQVDRVDERLGLMILIGRDGTRLRFAGGLLSDRLRLRRALLLHLPSRALSNALRLESQRIVMGDVSPMPRGGLAGSLRVRPRLRWQAGAGAVLVMGALLLVFAGAMAAGGVLVMVSVALGVALAVAGGAALLWLCQRVEMNEAGVSVVRWPLGGRRSLAWGEIRLVEVVRREIVVHFWAREVMGCPGPRLLPPSQRDVMRAYLHEYLSGHGIPFTERPLVRLPWRRR